MDLANLYNVTQILITVPLVYVIALFQFNTNNY